MAQWAKTLFVTLAECWFKSWLHHSPGSLVLMCLGRQGMMANPWVSTIYVGDLDSVLGSWLRAGPTLDVAVIWGVDKQMENLPCSLSLLVSMCVYFSVALLFKQTNICFKIKETPIMFEPWNVHKFICYGD